MRVQQISIFLENKSGRLSEVARVLGDNGINIRALSLADTTDFGILRLIVNDTEKASAVLKKNGFTVGKTEVIAVEVEDRPGGLAKILEILNKETINVEYMYAFVERSRNNAVIIFRFDDQNIDRAIKLLKDAGIAVLKGENVYTL
ncbi:MAG: ACT domain-containing protein [bacterium]